MEKLESILATLPPPVRVLEAGGGSTTRVQIPGASYVVIDISPEQLERNTYADEKLLGDLQTFDYGPARFDVALFWDVLEHLKDPREALTRAAAAIKPQGLIVIKGPVLRSLKGLTTKLTPHWVHVAYYRLILDRPEAGKPGYAPFKTEHAGAADPEALAEALVAAGFRSELYESYVAGQVDQLRRRAPPIYWFYRALSLVLRGLTGGRYGGLETEFVLVMRRS
jgi:ubiquinone/menaquinone biosynthesis C-methylase UbiE